tara:strand:+ start:1802 stop:2158 length:357 start_codon:yes stop_codon:yes gene_type:complete
MSFRYNNRRKFRNFNVEGSRFTMPSKGITRGNTRGEIVQYISPYNTYPTDGDFDFIYTKKHVWRHHDKFYKLAATYYGDPKVWWFIPWFNQKPLESDYKPGDVIEIPFPVDDLYRFFA